MTVHGKRTVAATGTIGPVPRVTSQDVARRAGVSQSTVSLVLSGKAPGRISAATVRAVERAADELGYRPNQAARTLRTGRTGAVGLLVPDVVNPFFGRLLRGAQREGRRHGLTVALVDAANEPEIERSSIDALRSASVDGYLAFEVHPPPGWPGEEPVVAIEGWDEAVPSVRFDVEAGTTAAIEHLLELGHRRIGQLASVHRVDTFMARDRRAAEVLAAAGIDPASLPRVESPFELDRAREAAHELLDAAPTAVHCADDILASGVVLAARDRGLDIPGELSVVGFDDLDVARVLDLTTVALDAEALGATAMAVLAELMAGGEPPQETVLPVALRVRGSTAPAA